MKRLNNIQSFLEISKSKIVMSTMKLSDDKKGITLRIYETEGKKTFTKIKFAYKIKNVKLIDFMENEIQEIKAIEKNEITILANPFQIITLKVFFREL